MGASPDGADVVYVARFAGHKSIAVHMPLGRRLSMYCTASGRSYLSARPDRDVATIIAQSRLIGVNIAQSEFEYPSASASSAS
jgi:DNA-binding IclR family transcriptional regulator